MIGGMWDPMGPREEEALRDSLRAAEKRLAGMRGHLMQFHDVARRIAGRVPESEWSNEEAMDLANAVLRALGDHR